MISLHNVLSYVCTCPPPEPTLTVENVAGVMEKVAVERRKEVCVTSRTFY